MTDNALATALAAAAGTSALIVSGLVKRADYRRAAECLAAQPCPRCGRPFGHDISDAMDSVKYHWMAAPGNSVRRLGLPRVTYMVTCPCCCMESEFREDGRPFLHPQSGVLNFTRTGKPRTNSVKE